MGLRAKDWSVPSLNASLCNETGVAVLSKDEAVRKLAVVSSHAQMVTRSPRGPLRPHPATNDDDVSPPVNVAGLLDRPDPDHPMVAIEVRLSEGGRASLLEESAQQAGLLVNVSVAARQRQDPVADALGDSACLIDHGGWDGWHSSGESSLLTQGRRIVSRQSDRGVVTLLCLLARVHSFFLPSSSCCSPSPSSPPETLVVSLSSRSHSPLLASLCFGEELFSLSPGHQVISLPRLLLRSSFVRTVVTPYWIHIGVIVWWMWLGSNCWTGGGGRNPEFTDQVEQVLYEDAGRIDPDLHALMARAQGLSPAGRITVHARGSKWVFTVPSSVVDGDSRCQRRNRCKKLSRWRAGVARRRKKTSQNLRGLGTLVVWGRL